MEQSPSWEADRFSVSQEIPRIYGNRKFITASTSARHQSLSWARSIQSMLSHTTFWRYILILSSHLRQGFCKWSISLRFHHQTTIYTSPLPHTCYTPHPSHSSLYDHPNNIGWRIPIVSLHIMQFSPFPCYLVPLRPNYSPQPLILKHPQPKFLPQSERPSFTPIHNNRQNYKSLVIQQNLR